MSYLIHYVLIFIVECSEFRKGGWLPFSHLFRDADYGDALLDMDGHSPRPFRELGETLCPGLIWHYI